MRISELCERSGVPISTIKFYLREGLLPAGERSAPNQARYDERHLQRLELIRALRDVAGLSVDAVRGVLAELDRGWEGDPVGTALRAASLPEPEPQGEPELEALREEIRSFVLGLDWTLEDAGPHLGVEPLARALLQVRRYLFPDLPVAALAPYARVAWLLSEVEYAQAPGGARVPLEGDDLTDPTRRAVLGSILFGRIFGALRNSANAMRSMRTTRGLPQPEAKLLPSDRKPRRPPGQREG